MSESKRVIRNALIVTGGYCNAAALAGRLPEHDIVVAADSGQRTCRALGVVPDVVCGDFDSSEAPEAGEAEIVRVPVRKDVTDTMLACNIAVERGANTLTIVGGTGGRLAALLNEQSGSSAYYMGSVIAYDNSVK